MPEAAEAKPLPQMLHRGEHFPVQWPASPLRLTGAPQVGHESHGSVHEHAACLARGGAAPVISSTSLAVARGHARGTNFPDVFARARSRQLPLNGTPQYPRGHPPGRVPGLAIFNPHMVQDSNNASDIIVGGIDGSNGVLDSHAMLSDGVSAFKGSFSGLSRSNSGAPSRSSTPGAGLAFGPVALGPAAFGAAAARIGSRCWSHLRSSSLSGMSHRSTMPAALCSSFFTARSSSMGVLPAREMKVRAVEWRVGESPTCGARASPDTARQGSRIAGQSASRCGAALTRVAAGGPARLVLCNHCTAARTQHVCTAAPDVSPAFRLLGGCLLSKEAG